MNAGLTADEINLTIGRRLAERRRELGLSLAQVARHCNVSLQQVHRYEIGQTPLSVPMLVTLSQRLDAPLSYFLGGLDAPL